jgi:hypothetical protein
MVARLTLRVFHLCLSLTLAVPYLIAQDSRSTSNPASVGVTEQREGLLDFALKRINPSDLNYGQCLDEGRKLILEQTLSRGYFWSNLAALGLLGVFLVVIVHQQRLQDRRELIASGFLAQYHNALARAEAVAGEAIKRNHALMGALTALSESGVPREASESSAPKGAPTKERKRVQSSIENGTAVPLAPVVAAARGDFRKPAIAPSSVAKNPEFATSKDSQATDQITLFGAGADLTAKINSLQQQLDVSKEEKKELLRQISFAEVRLQKEQQKNRSLKSE